jgi:arsenate reductase (thioredoxin)
MGCGDECPYVPGKRYIDWDLADPADKSLADVRAIRDDIRHRVGDLLVELDSRRTVSSGT